MSKIESNRNTESLAGSFRRNVKIGEDGLGMIYDQPGDVFRLKETWESTKTTGTKRAPGFFKAIYITEEFENITYLNRISYIGEWIQVRIDKDGKISNQTSNIEELLQDEKSHVLNIKEVSYDKPIIKEVVFRRWGHFTAQNERYSRKMKQISGIDVEIPECTIERDFMRAYTASRRT